MSNLGAEAQRKLARLKADVLSPAGAVATLGEPSTPLQITVRPMGRDPQGSDYGRLPNMLLQDLEHTQLEPAPEEINGVWRRYLNVWKPPPPPQSVGEESPVEKQP